MFSTRKIDINAISVKEMRQVFRRNRGAKAQIAREIEVSPCSISLWLKRPFPSPKIEPALRRRAAELLAAERERAA